MANARERARCCTCSKEAGACICAGCLQRFCWKDFQRHRQIQEGQLEKIENDHDLFRQMLIDQMQNSNNHPLIERVNRWEEDSINQIHQRADQCRQDLIQHVNKCINEIDVQLSHLAQQLKECREGKNFNEIDLNQLREDINKLNNAFENPPTISIEEEPTTWIKKISVIVPVEKGNSGRFCLTRSRIAFRNNE